jgi:hypothetical protein
MIFANASTAQASPQMALPDAVLHPAATPGVLDRRTGRFNAAGCLNGEPIPTACSTLPSMRTIAGMNPEKTVAYIALGWLIGSILLMSRSIQRGRDLAEELATRHPKTFENLGRPRPSFFESVRRTRFAQFVGRREFEDLSDEYLASQFEAYRKTEARLILSILALGVAVAVIGLFVRHAA